MMQPDPFGPGAIVRFASGESPGHGLPPNSSGQVMSIYRANANVRFAVGDGAFYRMLDRADLVLIQPAPTNPPPVSGGGVAEGDGGGKGVDTRDPRQGSVRKQMEAEGANATLTLRLDGSEAARQLADAAAALAATDAEQSLDAIRDRLRAARDAVAAGENVRIEDLIEDLWELSIPPRYRRAGRPT